MGTEEGGRGPIKYPQTVINTALSPVRLQSELLSEYISGAPSNTEYNVYPSEYITRQNVDWRDGIYSSVKVLRLLFGSC